MGGLQLCSAMVARRALEVVRILYKMERNTAETQVKRSWKREIDILLVDRSRGARMLRVVMDIDCQGVKVDRNDIK